MSLERLQPEGLPAPPYSQVVVGRGQRLIFVSGQISVDEEGRLVGPGDLGAQARQALSNLLTALAAAGAGAADVAKMTTYVVGYRPEMLSVIREARAEVLQMAESPASTLVGVVALAAPEYLFEVEAYALLE